MSGSCIGWNRIQRLHTPKTAKQDKTWASVRRPKSSVTQDVRQERDTMHVTIERQANETDNSETPIDRFLKVGKTCLRFFPTSR